MKRFFLAFVLMSVSLALKAQANPTILLDAVTTSQDTTSRPFEVSGYKKIAVHIWSPSGGATATVQILQRTSTSEPWAVVVTTTDPSVTGRIFSGVCNGQIAINASINASNISATVSYQR